VLSEGDMRLQTGGEVVPAGTARCVVSDLLPRHRRRTPVTTTRRVVTRRVVRVPVRVVRTVTITVRPTR
jgi:hypothetical protein